MSATQHAATRPVRGQVAQQAPPSRRKPAARKACSPRSTYGDITGPGKRWTAIPDVFFTHLAPQLNKTEVMVMLTTGRLTVGQRHKGVKEATEPISSTTFSKAAGLKGERRMADIAVGILLEMKVLGREAAGGKYRYWWLPENWETAQKPEAAKIAEIEAEAAENEQDEAQIEGEETGNASGNRLPVFTLAPGARSKSVTFSEPATRIRQCHNRSSSSLSIQAAVKSGELILSIVDAPAAAPKAAAPAKEALDDVRRMLNGLLRGKMAPAEDQLCRDVAKRLAPAKLADLELKLASRTRNMRFVTPALVLSMVDEVAKAARAAASAERRMEAQIERSLADQLVESQAELARHYAAAPPEQQQWMREKLGYKP